MKPHSIIHGVSSLLMHQSYTYMLVPIAFIICVKEDDDACKTLCKKIVDEWLKTETERKKIEKEQEEKSKQLNEG